MRAYDLIHKKRSGAELSAEEIKFLVNGFTKGEVTDYQMSAFFMAVFFKGMADREIFALTEAMVNSGEVINLQGLGLPTADKHSTGGVGDGTSLIIAPLAAACGVAVPMMSGRALGHTGGTLDKLESIAGFNVNQNKENFFKILREIGVCMTGQTEQVAPADKKMYALRDATATVEAIPLITASIMSKKIAEGASTLVLDVKFGAGAFMQNYEDAQNLAEKMLTLGRNFGRRMGALITNMNTPLGNSAGNSLEIKQAVEILQGKIKNDLYDLSLELAAMMVQGATGKPFEEAKKLCESKISSGEALNKFLQMVTAQGGAQVIDNPDKFLPKAKKVDYIKAQQNGFITNMNAREIGIASMMLGAGRLKTDDAIDHSAGIVFIKKTGGAVKTGDVVAELHHNNPKWLEEAKNIAANAYSFGEVAPEHENLIVKRYAFNVC